MRDSIFHQATIALNLKKEVIILALNEIFFSPMRLHHSGFPVSEQTWFCIRGIRTAEITGSIFFTHRSVFHKS